MDIERIDKNSDATLVFRNKHGAVYEGTVVGDQLKGIIKFRGIGQTWTLDGKRAKE